MKETQLLLGGYQAYMEFMSQWVGKREQMVCVGKVFEEIMAQYFPSGLKTPTQRYRKLKFYS